MALENKEPMQKYLEASTGCLQNTVPLGNLQHNRSDAYGFLWGKDKPNTYSRARGANLDIREFAHSPTLVPTQECKSHVNGQESEMWTGFCPEFLNTQDYSSAVEPHYHSFNKYGSYIDYQMQFFPSTQGYQPESQEFQYFVVIDFEATCDKDKKPHPQEIIEFPSVLVNGMTGELEDCFQIYVRPTYNQQLSDFCKELTGIEQIQVDKGVPLSEALHMHDKWLEEKGIKQTKFAIVTWSNWDCRVVLESECRFKKIKKPLYFNRWINLKVPFYEAFGSVRCNLKEAVKLAGLIWEGRAHCGLDDARNTARLVVHLMHDGFKLKITSSLPFPSTDGPNLNFNDPMMPCIDFHPVQSDPPGAHQMYCFCGVKSSKRMVRKPGTKHGSFFFGCGNWTTSRGAVCPYFEWATS
ncbi:hypothetical protein MLD38_008147 [Melastoma candidum]|uniref:Uncharacterized protein n=1 Tax=Melastoma candidum TaxID=119954 RepID=A0ACB9RUQ1_9MYRT|nr:hypothetical protein MLD38_008147 [Melastoma candidum]